jgi:hypothetical protein
MIEIAFHTLYAHALPAGHRFLMEKYELIPAQLLHEGSITKENLVQPIPVDDEIVLFTHDKYYVQKLKTQTLSLAEERKIGFPQSVALSHRQWLITQGTINCSLSAFKNGIALNVAGGTHHAFSDHGEGFCLLNDFAVAANYLLWEKLVNQVLIIDVDVHHGNGTAAISENEGQVLLMTKTKAAEAEGNATKISAEAEKEAARLSGQGVALFREEVARGMSQAAEQMKQANLVTNVILFSMWTEAIKNFAEAGMGNVIFLDGSPQGMDKNVQQIMAMLQIKNNKIT